MQLQRRHAQPVVASWYSHPERGRDAGSGEGDEDSEDDGSVVNGYVMVLHGRVDDESDHEEEADQQYGVNECAVI
ncbi:hypothetical protein L7F22_035095 [Adiantum nelumboides]|nr:hypothetical protein [Adiantum nelumboides]